MTTTSSSNRAFPDGISNRNLSGDRGFARHASPLSILLLGALLLAGLAGVAGGDSSPIVARNFGVASVSIDTPHTLRNGEFFETRIRIRANSDLTDATLAITPDLWHDMTINTTLPEPAEQTFDHGMLRWSYGPMKAGDSLTIKIDGQINPPLFAGTHGAFMVYDGTRKLGALPLSIRVFP